MIADRNDAKVVILTRKLQVKKRYDWLANHEICLLRRRSNGKREWRAINPFQGTWDIVSHITVMEPLQPAS